MRRVLKGLIDSSLLMTREDNDGGLRYYLLETVQDFARLQLGTSSTDATYRFINFHAAFGYTDSLARIDTKGGAQVYQELRLRYLISEPHSDLQRGFAGTNSRPSSPSL